MSRLVRKSAPASELSLEGSGKVSDHQSKSRIILTMAIVGLIYSVIVLRLAYLGFQEEKQYAFYNSEDIAITAARPDIRDRNGEMLATDLVTSSLFAEPRLIVDVDEAVDKLLTVLPELDAKTVHRRLSSNAGFVWLKRELTPATESKILALGIPGIDFRTETRRFYPNGETASHIVGYTNIDNVGIAGIEKYIDDRGLRQLQKLGFANVRQPPSPSINKSPA